MSADALYLLVRKRKPAPKPSRKRTRVKKVVEMTPARVLAEQISPGVFEPSARVIYGADYQRDRRLALSTAERYLRALVSAGFVVEKKTKL